MEQVRLWREAQLADVGALRRINGMGEPDPYGSYVALAVQRPGDAILVKVSLPAAVLLADEINGLIGSPSQ